MTTESQAVAEIMTRLTTAVAAWSAYTLVVEIPNKTLVDQATQTNPYLQVAISMLSGEQLDMGDNRRSRQFGQLILMVVAKGGTGMIPTSALRDHLAPYFNMENLGTVVCEAAELHMSKPIKGWEYSPLVINFWYTQLKT